MPEIELKPKTIEATARRRRPLSKPLAWFYVAVAVALLGWLYLSRFELSAENLFMGTAFVAIGLGVLLGALFQHID